MTLLDRPPKPGTLAEAPPTVTQLTAVPDGNQGAKIGLPGATALVIGSIIGTGIFSFGWAVALVAVVSGIGALNGWTMICAEMPYAAARDRVFPRAFAWTTKQDVPLFAIVSGAALASAAAIFSYSGEGGLNAFLTLVYLTGVTAAIPYFFSALAQVYFVFTDPRRVSPGRLFLDTFVAIMAGLFSLWFVYGSGSDATYWAFLMILAGFAVYAVMKIIDRRHPTGSHPIENVLTVPDPISKAVTR